MNSFGIYNNAPPQAHTATDGTQKSRLWSTESVNNSGVNDNYCLRFRENLITIHRDTMNFGFVSLNVFPVSFSSY